MPETAEEARDTCTDFDLDDEWAEEEDDFLDDAIPSSMVFDHRGKGLFR